jgi:hypothetical protein
MYLSSQFSVPFVVPPASTVYMFSLCATAPRRLYESCGMIRISGVSNLARFYLTLHFYLCTFESDPEYSASNIST